ncbi:hypothetical protein MNBD_GAMMA03-1616 [hydrothermal vent metagenome]|uniref:Uncharacterized protein n=1 Tax=hydrothermal vent metagenome TaxID=652676 RepID=A0A3B0VPR6_9ZZZZ
MVFSINAEIAQKNMDINLDSDDYVMQSQLFKQAKNIVASIHMEGLNLVINSALTTKEPETAIQIEKIINGIAAMSAFTDTQASKLQSQLIENLQVKRDNKIIFVNTGITLSNKNKLSSAQ